MKKIILLFLIIILAGCIDERPLGEINSNSESLSEWKMFKRTLDHQGFYPGYININNISLLWGSHLGSVDIISLIAEGGLVYVGVSDNKIYALDALTGEIVWGYGSGRNDIPINSISIANNLVFVGDGDNRISALNKKTGELEWEHFVRGAINPSAISKGIIYFGTSVGFASDYYNGKTIYALNTTNGMELWNFTTGNEVYSSPAIFNDVVYIGSWDGKIYALDAYTGDEIWNYSTQSRISSSPLIAEGLVYIGDREGTLYALDLYTGNKIWNYSTMGSEAYHKAIISSPSFYKGIIYFGSYDRYIYALNATTGDKIWDYKTDLEFFSSPVITANGLLFIANFDYEGYHPEGYLYAIDSTTRTKLWEYYTGGVVSSPAIVDGILYIGSIKIGGGNFYAFGTPCTDTDEGLDYYTYGNVQDRFSKAYDACIDENGTAYDSGIYPYLNEQYCINHTRFSQTYTCPDGCSEGACLNLTRTCTDTDGGRDYFAKGTLKSCYAYLCTEETDRCENTYPNVFKLFEYYCTESGFEGEVVNCEVGCEDGACLNLTRTCKDTDNGQDYYIKGNCTVSEEGAGAGTFDFCVDSRTLKECYCLGTDIKLDIYECPCFCQKGTCVEFFFYDFEEGDAEGWTVLDGTWTINSGYNSTYAYHAENNCCEHRSLYPITLEEGIFEVDFLVEEANQGGMSVLIQYQNSSNFYLIGINPITVDTDDYIIRRLDDVETYFSITPQVIQTNEWHHLKVIRTKDEIKVYLDDNLHMQLNDTSIQGLGDFVLRSWFGASFDNIKISTLNPC